MTSVLRFLNAPSTASETHLAIDFYILSFIVFSMLGFREFRSVGATLDRFEILESYPYYLWQRKCLVGWFLHENQAGT